MKLTLCLTWVNLLLGCCDICIICAMAFFLGILIGLSFHTAQLRVREAWRQDLQLLILYCMFLRKHTIECMFIMRFSNSEILLWQILVFDQIQFQLFLSVFYSYLFLSFSATGYIGHVLLLMFVTMSALKWPASLCGDI